MIDQHPAASLTDNSGVTPANKQAGWQTSRRMVALLWVIVVAILISFAFFASSLCIILLLAGFLAILCDPIPTRLERWRIPRALSSPVLIFNGMFLLTLVIYSSYGRMNAFVEDFPDYADRI